MSKIADLRCRIVEEEASDKNEQEHQLAILELLKRADRLRRRLKKPSGKREKRKLQVLQTDQSIDQS